MGDRRARGPFTCNHCGKEYMTRRREGEGEKYCSRECAYKDRDAWNKSPLGAPTSTRLPEYTRLKECNGCQSVLISSMRRYCGDCKQTIKQIKQWSQCAECNELFKQENKYQTVCSSLCYESRRMRNREKRREFTKKLRQERGSGRNRTRARYFGVEYEYINVMKVFERDGWTCQICGVSTPKSRRGTKHFNAPELDHRIPMSKGGGHLYSNVQCACKRCNAQKSNNTEHGQMPMFQWADITQRVEQRAGV